MAQGNGKKNWWSFLWIVAAVVGIPLVAYVGLMLYFLFKVTADIGKGIDKTAHAVGDVVKGMSEPVGSGIGVGTSAGSEAEAGSMNVKGHGQTGGTSLWTGYFFYFGAELDRKGEARFADGRLRPVEITLDLEPDQTCTLTAGDAQSEDVVSCRVRITGAVASVVYSGRPSGAIRAGGLFADQKPGNLLFTLTLKQRRFVTHWRSLRPGSANHSSGYYFERDLG